MKTRSIKSAIATFFAALLSVSTHASANELSEEEATEWGRIGISCFWPDGRFQRAGDMTARLPDSMLGELSQYLQANRAQGGDRFRVIRAQWQGGILGTPYDTLLVLHVDEGVISDSYRIGVLSNLIPPTATCDLAQSFGSKP